MEKTYCKIYKYVEEISEKLNTLLLVEPRVKIVITPDEAPNGLCIISISSAYIEVRLPHTIDIKKVNETQLTLPWYKDIISSILIHEYCHYIDAVNMTLSGRKKDIQRYNRDVKYRRMTEIQTWKNTKIVAKWLGMWDKQFFKRVKEYHMYTGKLKY